jgi:hypothetical protein
MSEHKKTHSKDPIALNQNKVNQKSHYQKRFHFITSSQSVLNFNFSRKKKSFFQTIFLQNNTSFEQYFFRTIFLFKTVSLVQYAWPCWNLQMQKSFSKKKNLQKFDQVAEKQVGLKSHENFYQCCCWEGVSLSLTSFCIFEWKKIHFLLCLCIKFTQVNSCILVTIINIISSSSSR